MEEGYRNAKRTRGERRREGRMTEGCLVEEEEEREWGPSFAILSKGRERERETDTQRAGDSAGRPMEPAPHLGCAASNTRNQSGRYPTILLVLVS